MVRFVYLRLFDVNRRKQTQKKRWPSVSAFFLSKRKEINGAGWLAWFVDSFLRRYHWAELSQLRQLQKLR